jgi:hypothetical protein
MDLCKKQMTRTRVKGIGSKAASSPSTEPNLYTMEPCYEQAALSDVMITDIQARLHEDTSSQTSKKENNDEDAMIPFVEDPEAELATVLAPTLTGSQTKSLPAMVSPPEQPKAVMSPSNLMSTDLFSPLLAFPALKGKEDEDCSSIDSDQEASLHSCDQDLFEGLPFHYLETKDIEDKLFGVVQSSLSTTVVSV